MNATTLGATINLFFLFHAQLVSSSGWMSRKEGRSSSVTWLASSSGEMRNTSSTAPPPTLRAVLGRLCVFGFTGTDEYDVLHAKTNKKNFVKNTNNLKTNKITYE